MSQNIVCEINLVFSCLMALSDERLTVGRTRDTRRPSCVESGTKIASGAPKFVTCQASNYIEVEERAPSRTCGA